MKNTIKTGLFAIMMAVTAASCEPSTDADEVKTETPTADARGVDTNSTKTVSEEKKVEVQGEVKP